MGCRFLRLDINISDLTGHGLAAASGARGDLSQGRLCRHWLRHRGLGRCEQTRPFLYIGERIEGTTRLLRSGFFGPVNVGSEEMVSINQLVDLVGTKAGKRIIKKHVPRPQGVSGGSPANRLIAKRKAGVGTEFASVRRSGGMVVDAATEAAAASAGEASALVQTQIDVLQSKWLITGVVHDLNLMQEPGLVPAIRLPTAVVTWLTAASDFVKGVWRSINGSGPVDDGEDQTVGIVQKQLQVEAKDGSKLVSVRFFAGSPVVAARVANAIMSAYVSSDNDVRNNKVAKINAYIEQQSAAMAAGIDIAQQKLHAIMQQHNLPEMGGGSAAALQLSKDEEQLSIAREQLALRQAAFDTMSHGGTVQGAEETLESQTIQSLKSYEAQITQQIGMLSPSDPRRYSLQSSLNTIRAQLGHENDLIYQSVARNVAIARAKVQSLEAAVQAEFNSITRGFRVRGPAKAIEQRPRGEAPSLHRIPHPSGTVAHRS